MSTTRTREQPEAQRPDLIRAVVRGQLPLSKLQDAGVSFIIEKNEARTERRIQVTTRSPVCVNILPIDLALGLLQYKDSPAQLQEWATFILCDTEVLDFSSVEDQPRRTL